MIPISLWMQLCEINCNIDKHSNETKGQLGCIAVISFPDRCCLDDVSILKFYQLFLMDVTVSVRKF